MEPPFKEPFFQSSVYSSEASSNPLDKPVVDIVALAAEIEAIKTRLTLLEEYSQREDDCLNNEFFSYGGTTD